jgi:hypothetical protein
MLKTPLRTWSGYYDNRAVTYVFTDTSSQKEALTSHVNYSARLGGALSQAHLMYLVSNGRFEGGDVVFDARPGKPGYAPLWQEIRVTWINPSQAVSVRSAAQIMRLAKAGKVVLVETSSVLNCPISSIFGIHVDL